jgi:hypothetical protein
MIELHLRLAQWLSFCVCLPLIRGILPDAGKLSGHLLRSELGLRNIPRRFYPENLVVARSRTN